MYRTLGILATAFTVFMAGCAARVDTTATKPTPAPKLVAISVTPSNPSVPIGHTQQFSATGKYSDGSTSDLTTTVSWRSSQTNVGAISRTGLFSPLSQGTTKVMASISGVNGSTMASVSPAAVVSLAVSPSSAAIAFGTEKQFTAVGTLTDGTTQNLTASVSWSSSHPGVANINSTGIVTGVSAGTTVITASSGSVSATASLTVTNATIVSLAITPGNTSVPIGVVRQFVATGTFSDRSTQDINLSATWGSSNTAVATVESGGLVDAIGLGTTTLSATFQTASNSTTLTVAAPKLLSIAIQPTNPSVALGTKLQLLAIGTYDNGSTQNLTSSATWTSSATAIATVSAGLVTSQAAGTTTIIATAGTVTGSTSLDVTTATLVGISVTPATPTIAVGATKSFSATGSFSDGTTENLTNQVTWNSSNPSVAGVSGSVATGVGAGTTTISASMTISGSTVSGSTTLAVSSATLTSVTLAPVAATILVGGTQQFTLTGHYSDGTSKNLSNTATWNSSDITVASVNAPGVATGIQGGTCTITATYGSFSPVAASLTVSGGTLRSISVSPVTATIAPETTQQFAATGIYSDGSTRNLTAFVSWTSSDYSVATISVASGSQGLATAIAPGNVVIGALLGSLLGSGGLTVSDASLQSITINPTNPIISLGANQNFSAMGKFSDGTTQNITRLVTWKSSNPGTATINALGIASSVASGTTTISATMSGVNDATTLTVR